MESRYKQHACKRLSKLNHAAASQHEQVLDLAVPPPAVFKLTSTKSSCFAAVASSIPGNAAAIFRNNALMLNPSLALVSMNMTPYSCAFASPSSMGTCRFKSVLFPTSMIITSVPRSALTSSIHLAVLVKEVRSAEDAHRSVLSSLRRRGWPKHIHSIRAINRPRAAATESPMGRYVLVTSYTTTATEESRMHEGRQKRQWDSRIQEKPWKPHIPFIWDRATERSASIFRTPGRSSSLVAGRRIHVVPAVPSPCFSRASSPLDRSSLFAGSGLHRFNDASLFRARVQVGRFDPSPSTPAGPPGRASTFHVLHVLPFSPWIHAHAFVSLPAFLRGLGRVPTAHLVGVVELVVHEPGDDAGLAHALVAQEHQLVLGQGRRGATGTCHGFGSKRDEGWTWTSARPRSSTSPKPPSHNRKRIRMEIGASRNRGERPSWLKGFRVEEPERVRREGLEVLDHEAP
eukprot:scaffold741_cov336-Pavlova_lutheri.AAC.70